MGYTFHYAIWLLWEINKQEPKFMLREGVALFSYNEKENPNQQNTKKVCVLTWACSLLYSVAVVLSWLGLL